MELHHKARIARFFTDISTSFPVHGDIATFLITHLRQDGPTFANAIAKQTSLRMVLPKPKSIDTTVFGHMVTKYNLDDLDRKKFSDPDDSLSYLENHAAGKDIILLDVGGYFASVLVHLCEHFSGHIVGVVEDTENGHQRYEQLSKLHCPVYSVARSPLKNSEDYLVGQSIVFGAESLVRSCGDILAGREALVMGFGKVGAAAAQALRAKSARVTVYDINAERLTYAMAQGYHVANRREQALHHADLIVCATGNQSLAGEDYLNLKNGVYVASATSSEDELDLTTVRELYTKSPVAEKVARYSTTGHYFYLLNEGNAPNFLHIGGIGSYIHLVQAEILAALSEMSYLEEPGMREVSAIHRQLIAGTWLQYFNR
jgi:adenosylhomocysteinase